MAIRDTITGVLLRATTAGPKSVWDVDDTVSELFGAVSDITLPEKTFRRNTQNDPVGVTRRAAVMGVNEMRLTGNLRVWDPRVLGMLGTTTIGEEVKEGGKNRTRFEIRIATEGYHFQNPRASKIEFEGFWDEFGAVTIGPEQEETLIPFGVDLLYYAEYYSPPGVTDAEGAIRQFEYDAVGLSYKVKRGVSDTDPLVDLWENRKLSLGVKVISPGAGG